MLSILKRQDCAEKAVEAPEKFFTKQKREKQKN